MEPFQFLALGIFILTYILIILFYERKGSIIWLSVLALFITGILSFEEAFRSINWNVILLFFGMLFVSEVFLFSKMPDYLATIFANKSKNTAIAMIVICGFTSALSILLENVAVVLLVAPIALKIAKQCDLNPYHLFFGMAISSNLQGAGTLIGDPPSMLLGGFANMSFNDFFFIFGKPSIFFAVQVAALVSLGVLYFFFRKHSHKMPHIEKQPYESIIPSVLIVLLVVSLIVSSFLPYNLPMLPGILCLVFGLLMYGWYVYHTKDKNVCCYVKNLDWKTGCFLMGIFVLVESLSVTGVINEFAKGIANITGNNVFVAFMVIVWLSVLVSAFVDNIPYLVVMLPVTQTVIETIGANPYLLLFGLLLGASVGGNITPIGASANIVAVGLLKSHGFKPRFWDFVKIGLPFTIVSVVASSIFIWVVFA